MDRDDDGWIWAGTKKGQLLRYDPQARRHTLIDYSGEGAIQACLCADSKVYVLGGPYPKLRVYDRRMQQWQQHDYPVRNGNFWYRAVLNDGQTLLLPNYAGETIFWDTTTERGETVPYPFEGPSPGIVYLAEND